MGRDAPHGIRVDRLAHPRPNVKVGEKHFFQVTDQALIDIVRRQVKVACLMYQALERQGWGGDFLGFVIP